MTENEKHASRLELMIRCLSIPLADDVAAMEAGVAALRSAQTWQPIATAPKDGTPVLVLSADDERFVSYWKHGGWELFGAYARIHPVLSWIPLPLPPSGAEK